MSDDDEHHKMPTLEYKLSNSTALRILDSIIAERQNPIQQIQPQLADQASRNSVSLSAKNYVMLTTYDKGRSGSLSISAFGDDIKSNDPYDRSTMDSTLDFTKRLSGSMSLNILPQDMILDRENSDSEFIDSPESIRQTAMAYSKYAKKPMKRLPMQYKNSISWTAPGKHYLDNLKCCN